MTDDETTSTDPGYPQGVEPVAPEPVAPDTVAPAPFAPGTAPEPVASAPEAPVPPVQEPAMRAGAAASAAMPPSGAPGGARRVLIVLASIAVALLLVVAGAWWYLYARPGKAPAGTVVTVSIDSGSSVQEISAKLEKAGIVPSALGFELLVRALGAGDSFQAGTYRLKAGTPDDKVIAALELGHGADESVVTIPEGYSVRQIAARLKAKAGIDADEFTRIALKEGKTFKKPFLASNPTDSLEGYLFPKTYSIPVGAKPREVIELMLDQFGKDTARLDLSYARSKNLTLNDVVTIASIIERESMFKADQPKVASVLYNRLKSNMRLGLDTTIIYALGLETKERVYYTDLKVDSPYNTYKHDGLPPGAICNPGMAALKAAAHPAQTEYLYFLAVGKDGRLTFTTNSVDFAKAKAQMAR